MNEILSRSDLQVSVKRFYMPGDDNFYANANDALNEIPNKPYGNDGLILNDVRESYSGGGGVYKWKPADKLTIDFSLKQISETTFEIYAKDGRNIVKFSGTQRSPQDGTVTVSPPIVQGSPLATGQVVEFAWDYDTSSFVPFRIRHDRVHPNNNRTAVDVWRDIMNPISIETMRGHDLTAMRRYHNTKKKDMLVRSCRGNGVLLDIGAGRGGDLHKWKHLGNDTRVLAVEPNSDYLQEFQRRLTEGDYKKISGTKMGYHFDNKTTIHLLEAFGQDSEKIISTYRRIYKDSPVDCITIFNVLTFFFDKESSMDLLIKTIDELLRDGGHFMGMVMDGERVRELLVKHSALKEAIARLEPHQYWNLDTRSPIDKAHASDLKITRGWPVVSKSAADLKLAIEELKEPDPEEIGDHGWTISRTKPFTESAYGNEIKIHLGADTIVHDQIEYLVDFEELVRKLEEIGVVLEETQMLEINAETLSSSQQRLNSLYRAFTFFRRSADGVANPTITTESANVIVETETTPADLFKAMPVEPVTILSAGETATVMIDGKKAVRTGTDRGDCPLIAIARGLGVDMDLDDFIDTELKTAYTRGEIPLVSRYYPEWDNAREALSDCRNWRWLGLWGAISKSLKTKLVVITSDPFTTDIYRVGSDNYKKTVAIYSVDGVYDSLRL
jgi:hypothetical protein